MSNAHQKTRTPRDADLKGNPGIGSSKGMSMTGGDPAEIAGESTVEGDVENDTRPDGGVDPDALGRVNR